MRSQRRRKTVIRAGSILSSCLIARQDDHTAAIMFGEDKLLEIEFNPDGKVAVHKRKKEKPVAVDALDLMNALKLLLAS